MGAMGDPNQSDRHEQFVVLFARSEPGLHAFVLSMEPHWDAAEEIMQQTSLVLWRKFDEYRTGTSFLNWACQIARYELLNHRKKHQRSRLRFNDAMFDTLADESMQDAEQLADERRALSHCLGKLDGDDRSILDRAYAGRETIGQIADALGRTHNSLYKRLNRIRESLLMCIRRTLGGEGA